MFDNTNPYTIRFEETDGRKCYFVAFTDGQGNFREIEVSKAVYMEFCHFIKRERNLRRSDERHHDIFSDCKFVEKYRSSGSTK